MNIDNKTCFDLKDNIEITDTEIKRILPIKSTLLMDCCRKKTVLQKFSSLIMENSRAMSMDQSSELTRLMAKYDRLINEASIASVTIYSCGPDEYSRDTYEGGLFSKNFVKCAERSNGDISVVGAFREASAIVKNENSRQTPHIEMVRTGPYFPFAVVRFYNKPYPRGC